MSSSLDPYHQGMFQENPYKAKMDVIGRLVVVLDGRLEGRGLQLIRPISRALCRHEIHELIITNERKGPGQQVNRIAYLGFMEILQGGVLVAGDRLYVDGRLVGEVVGFDETHMPNHWNIVLSGTELRSGKEMGLSLGVEVKGVHNAKPLDHNNF
ncbi:MAG: DUF6917 domain-containing protein [Bacillota bacterium]